MFDIGFPELILIAIVGLLVIGPERLPEALRTLGLWLGRMRRSFVSVKAEIEKEIGMDEVKRQLHNEAIMDEMKRIEQEVKSTADTAQASLNEGMKTSDIPSIDPNTQMDIADAISAQDGVTPAEDDRSHADAADTRDDRSHADAADDRTHADAADEPSDADPTATSSMEQEAGAEADEKVKSG
jgi:sec-independent protein translocase protein TatB